MKLEMFPPGQDAASIMPSPIIGDIQSFIRRVRKKVIIGSRMNWHNIPKMTDLGFLNTSMKVSGFIPSATPNITNASTTLRMVIPVGLILTCMASNACAISCFITCFFSFYSYVASVIFLF